jgi:PAS domain S-box-containing protein
MRQEAVDSPQGVLSAEEALRFLDEVAAVLIGSLDYEQTLGRVAQLAVPLLADWCAVDILEDDGSLRQITSGHPDPEQEELLMQLRLRYRAEKGGAEGVASVIASGQPELRSDVRDAARIEIRPDESAVYDRLGPRSYVIVPLAARGRTLGALTLLSTRPGRHYGAGDMPIAMHLARRSSLAIDNARLYDTAEKSLGLLDTLFTTAPVGLGFVDTDLRFVRINEALAAMNGLSIDEHLGRTIHEVLGPFAEQVAAMYRRALEERRPVLGQEMVGFTPARPDETRYWVASYTPVIGLGEQIIGVGTVVIDVTEERHALQAERDAVRRATFLAEAGALLDASMDPAETLDNLARLAVPEFADWCTVHLLDEDGDLQQVAVAHTDPEKVDWAWELSRRYPPRIEPERGIGRVLMTGQPDVINDVSDELLVTSAIDDEHLAILRELGLTAAVLAPLTARGRTLGALSFVSAESSRHYGDVDVQLLVELGRRAGVALENAQLYTERSRIAHTLQARLLPSSLPSPPGLELAARYRAAGQYNEVGGDFYDAFERAPDEWVVVIGDVSGKGPEAAAMTALARYTIRSAALSGAAPCDVLRRLNDSLLYEEELQFITVAVAYLAPGLAGGSTAVRLALGGHPPPFILRADGIVEQVGEPGMLLGVHADPRLTEVQVALGPGDSLLLYTDGVTEAGPRGAPVAEAGLARLLASLRGSAPDELVSRIDAAARDADPSRARDDVALLAVHALAEAQEGALVLTRPAVPQSLRELRDGIVEFATQLPDLDLEGLRLAVGEACTNVVAHAYREQSEPGLVYLRATVTADGLVVEIRDEGCGPSPRVDSPGLGLGLPLMKHLSRELEITRREPAGTLVRMVF